MAGERAQLAAARVLAQMADEERKAVAAAAAGMMGISNPPPSPAKKKNDARMDGPSSRLGRDASLEGVVAGVASAGRSPRVGPCAPVRPLQAPPQDDSGGPDYAARRALELNKAIQASLREELEKIDQTLAGNREALEQATLRLSSRAPAISTSSDKFMWSRAVERFLDVKGDPNITGLRKEEENLLRMEPIVWLPLDIKALKIAVKKLYPAAVDPEPAKAAAALKNIDWSAVAEAVHKAPRWTKNPSRSRRLQTAEECRLRWVHYDMPGTTRADVWTKDEDMTIIEQAAEFQGTEWVQVAAAVKEETVAGMAGGAGRGGGIGKGVGQGRTPIACLKRYQRALNMELVNAQRWTEEEDARLMKAIQKHGLRQWLLVSREVINRTPHQCISHWRHRNDLPNFKTVPDQDPSSSSFCSSLSSPTATPTAPDSDPSTRTALEANTAVAAAAGGAMAARSSTVEPDGEKSSSGQGTPTFKIGRSGGGSDSVADMLFGQDEDGDDEDASLLRPLARGGYWTPTEERRLFLAVRALMPSPDETTVVGEQEEDERQGTGVEVETEGSGDSRGSREVEEEEGDAHGDQDAGNKSGRKKRRRAGNALGEERTRGTCIPTYESISKIEWAQVAKLMKNLRSDQQCREKWFGSLDPSINRDPWTPSEDAELLRSVTADASRLGQWLAIERDMVNWAREQGIGRRTYQQCKRRFAVLNPSASTAYNELQKKRRAVEPVRHASKTAFSQKSEISIADYEIQSESDDDDGATTGGGGVSAGGRQTEDMAGDNGNGSISEGEWST